MNFNYRDAHSRRSIGEMIATFSFIVATIFVLLIPSEAQAQRKCGAEGQRPCRVWERIPSCDKGLKEHFGLNMCVGPRTQVDADSGKYIPRQKKTVVSLCNKSSRPIVYAAMAEYVDVESGWVSHGWYNIPAGKCAKENLESGYTGVVYIYGRAPDGTEWNGPDSNFCIKTYDRFEIYQASSLQCPTRDHSIVGMVKFDVKPGNNNYNFGN